MMKQILIRGDDGEITVKCKICGDGDVITGHGIVSARQAGNWALAHQCKFKGDACS